MTARDQVSAVGEEVCSGRGEATRERGRLFVADLGSATAPIPPSAARDFEAERDPRLRVGVAAAAASFAISADFDATRDRLLTGLASTSTGVGAAGGDTTGVACALGLRPNPSALAIVERRSE